MRDPKLMAHILKLNMEQGRTLDSLASEYGVSSSTIKSWKRKFLEQAVHDTAKANELKTMEMNRKLKEENEELKKQVDFLKKAAAFFAKDQK